MRWQCSRGLRPCLTLELPHQGYPQVPGERLRLQSTGFEHGFAGQFPAVTWSGEAEPPSYRLAPDPDIVLLRNIFGIP